MNVQINYKIKAQGILLVLLLFAIKMSGQVIVVKNVKLSYAVDERFDIELENTSDSIIKYTVSIEQFIGNQDRWCEIIVDVFRPATYTSKRIHAIGGKCTVAWKFYLTRAPKDIKRMLPHKKCRLKVTDIANISKRSYSDSFIFK
ncbi:hypothetical protein [Niastella populi]|uniref:Uncharacterized protein n=1 Tax=Niastella populi TaxID=550983 RepID=A0A1V9EVC4_9BACT|nr:hypothetical protein [Niastella populi]OQP49972.1 hypothetical protein A4R26_30105 [Niastella populi]